MAFDAAPTIHVPGVLDIITANQDSNTIGVMLGNGNGTFQSAVTYATGTSPDGVAIGDLNGDGFADIVTSNYTGNNLTVFLGNGSGTFTASPISPIAEGASTAPESVTIADLNGDGFGDIISADFTSGNVHVFMNNGDGTFAAKTPFSEGTKLAFVQSADFNRDGKADLAVTDYISNDVKILKGDGNGGFTTSATITTGTNPVQVVLGDINGDGFTDVVVANYYSSTADGSLTIALGKGDGTFNASTTTHVAVAAGFSVAMGDVDGDGKPDLVLPGTSDSTLRVLKGDGAGGFTLANTISTAPPSSFSFRPQSIQLMDVNGDGKLDIVAAGSNNAAPGQGQLYVALGVGNGTFGAGTVTNSGGNNPNALLAASLRPVTTAKNTALVFSTGHNNAITVSDVDAASSSETMTLAVKHGTLTLAGTSGLTGVTGNGTASLSFQGTIANLNTALNGLTYTPTTGYHAIDNLVLTLNDGGAALTTTSSQAIKVGTGTNTAPVPVTDSATVQTGATATATSTTGVLHNDTDADSDTLTVTAIKNASSVSGTVGSALTGTYGNLTIQADGSYSYVNTSATGTGSHPVDAFTYTANDGNGGTANGTLNFIINRVPTVVTQTDSVVESATLAGTSGTGGTGALHGDSDSDGDALTVTKLNGATISTTISNVGGTYGHLTLSNNGSFSYVADMTSAIDSATTGSHPLDTFTVTVDDGQSGTTTGTLSFSIDRAPTTGADSYNVTESSSVSGTSGTGGTGVLHNDSDKDGDSLTITSLGTGVSVGSGANVGSGTFQGTYGHLNLAANGSFTYNADNTSAINGAATGSHPTDTFTYTANDGHGGTTTNTVTFTIDRPGIATADAITTTETTSVSAATAAAGVLANDSDPDTGNNTGLAVTMVNGQVGNVGTLLTLTDGAHLTVNADGTYTYDPNGAFNNLHLAAPSSHAANTSATETFTYTITGGSTVTATITVNGVNNANTIYDGTSGNDSITGDATLGGLYHLEQGGNDSVTGGAGNDGFYFGGAFTASDIVNGGGGTNNQIGLEGDYHLGVQLSGSEITGIQAIAMLPGSDYKLTSDGTLTLAGQTFTFWSVSMGSTNSVNLDMHSEPGNFQFYLGQGADTAIGGSGADVFYGEGGKDTLTGGGGHDTFAYLTATDSNGASGTAFDTITDFTAGTDKFQFLDTAVTTVNAAASGALSVASFDSDLAAVLGNGHTNEIDNGHAVLFTASSGGLSGETFLIVGTAGAATGYAAGQDYVIHLQGAAFGTLAPGDFV